ncbi:MAG: DUF4129 domain-containing protein [Candidatus Electrothrix sp. MAN1_4]|nr:DUF4129 domain-containing protein [Candidatus Electrothrix sp. MAN1_4]
MLAFALKYMYFDARNKKKNKSIPFGVPPLKRWAIINRPSGAGISGKQRPGGTAENSPVFQHWAQKTGSPLTRRYAPMHHIISMSLKINILLPLLCILAGLCLPLPGFTAPSTGANDTISERTLETLDQAITETLQQPEFAWRLPRDQAPEKEEASSGFLSTLFAPLLDFFRDIGVGLGDFLQNSGKWVGEHLASFFDWMKGLIEQQEPKERSDFNFKDFSQPLAWFLIAALVLLILVLLIKSFRHKPVPVEATPEPVQPVPDLTAETTTADQLEEDQWLALAGEMLEKNELRLALRALFLASLALLARHRLISIAPFKSNREYPRELARSAHALAGVTEALHENIRLFEKSWYGDHQISKEILAQVQENASQMRASCG